MIRFEKGTKCLGPREVNLEGIEGKIKTETSSVIEIKVEDPSKLPFDFDRLIFDDDTARDRGFGSAREMVENWTS